MSATVHLGFEVGTGEPVEIPIRHMVVTGQTQEAGKTTTLEALIARSELPAVAFVTKRGEQSFSNARRVPPYFRERADWQFVASVLEATMRERLKFERAWIMRASKGAQSLADVQRNVRREMEKAKGMSADVYLTLDHYLEIVVPRVATVKWAQTVSLDHGLNVMDLSDRDNFPPELQSLVMRSVLEWIYEKCEGTITLIPEAWEFIPQERGSPVKMAANELIRKGAGLRNYVWLDSQDIGGVDKVLLRQCMVWLLGVQREANEISRVLTNIPAGIAKPRAADVATLEKGQFYACWGRNVIKTYVQPEWMHGPDAQAVSTGLLSLESVGRPKQKHQPKEATVTEKEAEALRAENKRLQKLIEELERNGAKATVLVHAPAKVSGDVDTEALYQSMLARILQEPKIIELRSTRPELRVSTTREVIELDGKTLRGRLAKLVATGWFDEPRNGNTAYNELQRIGFSTAKPNVYRECDALAALGFLTKESAGYQAVKEMKVNIK